jgi:hypothetical protein
LIGGDRIEIGSRTETTAAACENRNPKRIVVVKPAERIGKCLGCRTIYGISHSGTSDSNGHDAIFDFERNERVHKMAVLLFDEVRQFRQSSLLGELISPVRKSSDSSTVVGGRALAVMVNRVQRAAAMGTDCRVLSKTDEEYALQRAIRTSER